MLSRPLTLSSAWTLTEIWLVTLQRPLATKIATWLVAGFQHFLSTATMIVELAVSLGVGKLVLDLLVVIAHAAPVVGVVLPMLDLRCSCRRAC